MVPGVTPGTWYEFAFREHSEAFGGDAAGCYAGRDALPIVYPLMEPSVMPFTKRRIEKTKRTITGMLAIA